jgi:short-subunit dehydrogenase
MTGIRPGPVHIVGAGPGVGAAVARRFAGAGHPVGLIARNRGRLENLARSLAEEGVEALTCAADATDPEAVTIALADLARRQGPAAALCFSPLPDVALIKPVLQTSATDLNAALSLNVVGAAAAVAAVLPGMLAAGRGSLLFVTGSAVINPSAARASSAVVGFAEKAYVELLVDALHDTALRVAHLVVKGAVGPGQQHEPDTVADRLWHLHADSRETFAVMAG